MKTIYLNNNATTQIDPVVLKKMLPYYKDYYENPSSISVNGSKIKEDIEESRTIISSLIKCDPDNVIFTSSGSEANNSAIFSLVSTSNSQKNHIITSKIEHPSVLNYMLVLQKRGFIVDFLNVDNSGKVSLDELLKKISSKTLLVSIMHVNNETGIINDIKSISEIVKKYGVKLHVDAVQSFGKLDIDTSELKVDFLSFSAHKIHGPKGVGGLYVRNPAHFNKFIHGGGQENNLRAGTENVPGIIGFGEAVRLINLTKVKEQKLLLDGLRDKISSNINKVNIIGNNSDRIHNTLNVCFKNIEGEAIIKWLEKYNIIVSTGSACSSTNLTSSHVLKALNIDPTYINGAVRFSISKYTSKEDIDYVAKHLSEIVTRLREISPFKDR